MDYELIKQKSKPKELILICFLIYSLRIPYIYTMYFDNIYLIQIYTLSFATHS